MGTHFQGTYIPKDKALPLSVGTDVRVLMARGDAYKPGDCLKAAGGLTAMYERNKALLRQAQKVAANQAARDARFVAENVTDLGQFKRNRMAKLNDWSE